MSDLRPRKRLSRRSCDSAHETAKQFYRCVPRSPHCQGRMQYHVLVNNACMELTETLAKSDCAGPRRNPQENHVTPSTRCAHAETRGERMQKLRQCVRTRFKHHVPLRSVLCFEDTDATKKTAFLTRRALCCECATASRACTINHVPQRISA